MKRETCGFFAAGRVKQFNFLLFVTATEAGQAPAVIREADFFQHP